MTSQEDALGSWLSAALEDPYACEEFKEVIRNWFKQFEVKINKASQEMKDIERDMWDALGR